MKVFIILAVICAVTAADKVSVSVGSGIEPNLNSTVPSNTTQPPQPNHPTGTRNGRYILLQTGGVYDTYYDLVIPSNAQYVIQQGSGGNRDIYLRTVPVSTVRREYILSSV